MITTILTACLVLWQSYFGTGMARIESPFVPAATTTAAVVQVIDGDTIDVQIKGSTKTTRVRYIGIDTPEPYAHGEPDCGSREASDRNRALVANKTVTLVPGTEPYDKYDRLLAYVYEGDTFVNQTLVAFGYARVMMYTPNTEYKTSFTSLYTIARAEKIGIWATCK